MGHESIAIVGRNGMGKTTLCNAIMGISPPRAQGSILFDGEELVGVASHKIARRGIGYVPQGRRLFPSLTVDQHLRIASRGGESNGSEWTRERVYELFPRLAERQGQRRSPALRRRAADARDRSRARDEPEDPRHGRALGGPCAGGDRGAHRDVQASRGRRGSRSSSSSRTSASRPRSPSGSSS